MIDFGLYEGINVCINIVVFSFCVDFMCVKDVVVLMIWPSVLLINVYCVYSDTHF